MSQTADGQMQALNALGQISDQQVQQPMKLRELMMADMSSKQALSGSDHPTAGRRSGGDAVVLYRRTGDQRRQDIFAGPPVD